LKAILPRWASTLPMKMARFSLSSTSMRSASMLTSPGWRADWAISLVSTVVWAGTGPLSSVSPSGEDSDGKSENASLGGT
jgi:hypothetical protein